MFGIGKKVGIRQQCFTVTPIGKERVENMEGQGPMLVVLTRLESDGPQTIVEISHRTGLDDYTVEECIKRLAKQGAVTALKSQEF